jgi:hypothetical protein
MDVPDDAKCIHGVLLTDECSQCDNMTIQPLDFREQESWKKPRRWIKAL